MGIIVGLGVAVGSGDGCVVVGTGDCVAVDVESIIVGSNSAVWLGWVGNIVGVDGRGVDIDWSRRHPAKTRANGTSRNNGQNLIDLLLLFITGCKVHFDLLIDTRSMSAPYHVALLLNPHQRSGNAMARKRNQLPQMRWGDS